MLRMFLYILAFWLLAFSMLPAGYWSDSIKSIFGWEPEKIYPHDDYDDENDLIFDGSIVKGHPSPYFKVYANSKGKLPTVKDEIKFPYFSQPNEKLAYISTSVKWKMPEEATTLPFLRYATEDQLGRQSHVHSWIYYDGDTARLPIASIVVNPDEFFSDSEGIYVRGFKAWEQLDRWQKPWWEWSANFKERGIEWERTTSFLLLDQNGNELIEENLGTRINGNATRAFPQKSLRLTFRRTYGKDDIKVEKLAKDWQEELSALILRNGGNDWDFTLIRDVLQHQVALKLGLLAQPYYSVRLYINGVYWGIHHLRPRANKTFFSEMLGIKKKQVSLYKEGEDKYNGEDYPVEDFFKAMKNENLWEQLNREKIFNYLALEIFAANTDWPDNNVMWTCNHEGKWEPVVKDMDCSIGYVGSQHYQRNIFKVLEKSNSEIARIYQKIIKDSKDHAAFIAHFKSLMKNELSPAKWISEMEIIKNKIAPEIHHHTKRWRKFSEEEWYQNLKVIEDFVRKREAVILEQIEQIEQIEQ